MKVKDFYDIYKHQQQKDMAEATYLSRTSLIRCNLLPQYGNDKVDRITSDDINMIYQSMRKQGLSQNSIFGMRAALKSFFDLAIMHGEAVHNPVEESEHIQPQMRN